MLTKLIRVLKQRKSQNQSRPSAKNCSLDLEVLESRFAPATFRYVDALLGSDQNPGSSASPFKTIQKAVDMSANTDWVLVAQGVYTERPQSSPAWSQLSFIPAAELPVVAVIDKQVAIKGGYRSGGNYTEADRNISLYPSVIDGLEGRRGVIALDNNTPKDTTLELDGFTIRNGVANPSYFNPYVQTLMIAGLGGGMFAYQSQVTLRDVAFEHNRAQGAPAGTPIPGDTQCLNCETGGAGVGGGLALLYSGSAGLDQQTKLYNVVFSENLAQGGSHTNKAETARSIRGGYGQGGGLYIYDSVVYGGSLTFTSNVAQGGSAEGTGFADSDPNTASPPLNDFADSQGGAIWVGGAASYSSVTLHLLSVIGNKSIGGVATNGANGAGGSAYGGGVYVETATSIKISDANIRSNESRGGDGRNNGDYAGKSPSSAYGGGAFVADSALVEVDGLSVIANAANAGKATDVTTIYKASSRSGSVNGGGLALQNNSSGTKSDSISIANSVIADNIGTVQGRALDGSYTGVGGGGAGLFIHDSFFINISHATIVRNHLTDFSSCGCLLGEAIVVARDVHPPTIHIDYSIIGEHAGPRPAIEFSASGPATASLAVTYAYFYANGMNYRLASSDPSLPMQPVNAIFTVANTVPTTGTPAFVAPGAPNYNYRLSASSPLLDRATGSSSTRDRDGNVRARSRVTGTDLLPATGTSDIGAYEFYEFTTTRVTNGYDTAGVATPDASFSWRWRLRGANNEESANSSPTDSVLFGSTVYTPLVGDWDGDGRTDVGVFDKSIAKFFLRTNNGIVQEIQLADFIGKNCTPLAGDWDGDGDDTIGVFCPLPSDPLHGNIYLRNTNTSGPNDIPVFGFGESTDAFVVGDWDGDGKDSVSAFRPSTAQWFLKNSVGDWMWQSEFYYGRPNWKPLVGDWNNDGIDTVGVYDPNTNIMRLRNVNGVSALFGAAAGDVTMFRLGGPDSIPFGGDWDDDRTGPVGYMAGIGAGKDDFNHDGRSDFIIRSGASISVWESGTPASLLEIGGSLGTKAIVGGLATNWTIVAIGDFDGDGGSDLMLRDGTSVYIWFMNGGRKVREGYVSAAGLASGWISGWNIDGTGDFNGDGRSDVLLRNGTSVYQWQMDGLRVSNHGYVTIGGLATEWVIDGIGDFNGDGRSDVLMRNGTLLYEWQMNGILIENQSRVKDGASDAYLGTNWSVEGVGDFNGDGKSDVLLRDGPYLYEWQMTGFQIQNHASVLDHIGFGFYLTGNWFVEGFGDFDGDKKTDILINRNGTLDMLLMNGFGSSRIEMVAVLGPNDDTILL